MDRFLSVDCRSTSRTESESTVRILQRPEDFLFVRRRPDIFCGPAKGPRPTLRQLGHLVYTDRSFQSHVLHDEFSTARSSALDHRLLGREMSRDYRKVSTIAEARYGRICGLGKFMLGQSPLRYILRYAFGDPDWRRRCARPGSLFT